MNKALNIITPIFDPAPGGAAQYYKILGECLADIYDVNIITEKHPLRVVRSPNYKIVELFPHRAGSITPPLLPRLKYAIQNTYYLYLLFLIPYQLVRYDSVKTIIHSSFFYYPNLLKAVLRLLRIIDHRRKLSIYLDIRDKIIFNKNLAFKESTFDGFFCSSEEACRYIRSRQHADAHFIKIPIDIEYWRSEPPDSGHFPMLAAKLALLRNNGAKIVLNPNGVSVNKYFPKLIELITSYQNNYGKIALLTCGKIKDAALVSASSTINNHELGSITQDELRYLYHNVDCAVVLDPLESPSRIAIESIISNCNVLLPANAEFLGSDPKFVANLDNFQQLEARFRYLLSNKVNYNYNVDVHSVVTVLERYRAIIEE